MDVRESSVVFATAILSLTLAAFGWRPADPAWPQATRLMKPWVYNWWMGSAVDEAGLEYQCRELAEKGFGGFHVIPIYGAKGYESKWKAYLSPEWLEAFAMAKRIGARHGLGVDLTMGSGWCFGGPWLAKEEGCWKLALGADGKLTPQLTGQQVKRAGPGGQGPMMNPFSPGAMDSFLRKFAMFDVPGAALPEHFYHDSYEYFGAAWSPELPSVFKARRGYDLMEVWEVFGGKGDPEEVARVKCDYRQTLDDLMVEEVFPKWVEWCHARGVKTRNEAHGAPANWLDLYALADVPETEMFGRKGRDILVSKFASSAAHVAGKPHVSAETCTWIAEHFNETLAECKTFIDRLFLAGVNHVFYHGCCYSPVEAPWPGWCFYASLEMNPRNPIWRDVGALNAYITRCQSVFQTCEPDNDVLLYWPIRDYWWDAAGYAKQMTVHDSRWLHGQPVGKEARRLQDEGYAFDYVSDRMLQNAAALGLKRRYAALVVPENRHMPEKTKAAVAALGLPDTSKARREPFADAGLMFTRMRYPQTRERNGVREWGLTTVYFLANQSGKAVNGRFRPSCYRHRARFDGAIPPFLMDPLTGRIRQLEFASDGTVELSLENGHSCFLWCVQGMRTIDYGGVKPPSRIWLDLGEVIGNESVRVTVNGKHLGTLIMPPYRIEVPEGVLRGPRVEDNDIVLDVCERAANRIRELDRKGVKWKYFTDINMVDIDYKPFDASQWPVQEHGVKGPVRLIRSDGLDLKAAFRVDGVDDRAMGVALDGKTLYCIAGRSLYALDVANPLAPKVVGRLDGMDNRRQVVVADGFAYVVSRETGLRIVDVRDPRKMRLRSRYDSVEFATGLDVVGKTVFLSERINGVEAVDVSDPDNPRHLCIRKTGESQSNRYRNGFLYSGEWGNGLVTVFDAHDMRAFRAIGTLDLGGFGDGLEVDGHYLYCSTGHDARHHRATQLKAGHRERKIDDLADPTRNSEDLVGAGRGFDIFNLADPSKPRHVSRVDFPIFKPRNDDFWTVRVADGLAFCCDSHNGLFVVDVHDPARPKVIDRFCVPEPGKEWPSGAISSVAVGEGCIYITSFPGGLWVVPVAGVRPPIRDKGTPPANATMADAYPTDKDKFHVYRPTAAGQARTACVRGDVVYAAFGDAGLHVVRIRPEGGFEKLGELPGGKRVTDCCFVGDRLVTAEGLDGWAVYAMDGSTGFREVARRPTPPDATVAFWCWPAGTRHAVLSSRNGPYCVLGLDDFARSDPLCKFYATCQWDKYLPDALVGDRLAILNPYSGLIWVDFSGPTPKTGTRECGGAHPAGAQVNGICAFGDRYLYTVDDRYQFVLPDGSRTELRTLPPVPKFQKTKRPRFTGIPRSDGRLVALTNRSGARYAVYDFADPQNPKLLDAGELSGRPDLAAFWNGHVIIPAGHQGLLLTAYGATSNHLSR